MKQSPQHATNYVDKAGLNLKDPPPSTSLLGLKALLPQLAFVYFYFVYVKVLYACI